MQRTELLASMRTNRVAVELTVSSMDSPQSAVVGIAVGDDFQIVFDTLLTSRKALNLRNNPRIALVLGGWEPGKEQTIQYEGISEEPEGSELQAACELYFSVYPDGRERMANSPGLIHVLVRPTWLRYSDFNRSPVLVQEFSARELALLK